MENSDFDKRQIELMEKQIHYFQEGKLDLGTFVSRLESLFSVLENKDKPWANSFWKEWDTLESVYADVLDEMNSRDESSHRQIIETSVKNLMKILSKIQK